MESNLTTLVVVGFLALAGLSIGSVSGMPVADKNATASTNPSFITDQLRDRADLVSKMKAVPHEAVVKNLMPFLPKVPLDSSNDGTLQIQVSLVNSSTSPLDVSNNSAAVNFKNEGTPIYTIYLGKTNHSMMLNPSTPNLDVSSFLQEFPFDLLEIKYVVINVTLYTSVEKEIMKKVMETTKFVIQNPSSLEFGDPFIVLVKKPKPNVEDIRSLINVLNLIFYAAYVSFFVWAVFQKKGNSGEGNGQQ